MSVTDWISLLGATTGFATVLLLNHRIDRQRASIETLRGQLLELAKLHAHHIDRHIAAEGGRVGNVQAVDFRSPVRRGGTAS